jgi:hypothetical protein
MSSEKIPEEFKNIKQWGKEGSCFVLSITGPKRPD